ncbi:MAG: hypothetical protein ACYCVD_18250 [Desulfitobacteriaceae bacterium]
MKMLHFAGGITNGKIEFIGYAVRLFSISNAYFTFSRRWAKIPKIEGTTQ